MLEARRDEAAAWNLLSRAYLGAEVGQMADPPVERIRQALHAEGEALVVASKQRGPPVVLEDLLQRRAVTSLVKQDLSFRDGLLLTNERGFEIRVNSAAPTGRQRAAVAHELGHTFFYNIDFKPPKKFVSFPPGRYWVEEGMAREIGRAILVPKRWIKSDVSDRRFEWSLQSILNLCDRYRVSVDVLAYRLVRDLHLLDSFLFFAESASGGEPGFNVKSSDRFRGRSFKSIQIPKSIPADHPLFSLLRQAVQVQPGTVVTERLSLGERSDRYRAEAVSLPVEGGSRLVGLISNDHELSQAKLFPAAG